MGNVFNRYGAGGGKSEGLYIWKKYGAGESVRQLGGMSSGKIIPNTTGNDIVYSATSYTYSNGIFTLVNPSIVVQGAGNYANGYNYMCIGGTSASELYVCNTNPSSTAVLVTINSNSTVTFSNSTGYILNELYTDSKAVFIGYVVSDKEDAYPDKEAKDGYYYEKVGLDPALFGCTKMEVGTFTPTSNLANYSINHNLGVIPKMALVWSDTATYNIRTVQSWNTSNGSTGSASVQSTEYYVRTTFAGSGSATVTTLIFYAYSDTSYRFQSGKMYHYVLFA